MNLRYNRRRCLLLLLAGSLGHCLVSCNHASGEDTFAFWRPEQQRLQIRQPAQLPQIPLPVTPRPSTVAQPQDELPEKTLSLTDAVNIALANSQVVRVLTGVTASTSGRTIYDAAVTNTRIDQERATFDPQIRVNNAWTETQIPNGFPNLIDPTQSFIDGNQTNGYGLDTAISQKNLLGGTAALGVRSNTNRITPGTFPLNPAARTATELSYTQPFWQGAGRVANQVPIVLARIDTERSYFQYKDSVQRLVQGVIEAYWTLVFAKTDLSAREQQVKQAEFANERTKARVEAKDANAGDLAQTQLALENFRAALLASQANVLQRQGALLNILGLPPFESQRTIPVTPMLEERIEIDWTAINELAQSQRPDIIELKLVLDADRQRALLVNNTAKPRLDGVALYRWNGLEGEVPAGNRIQSGAGDFTDWSLGVNFSVPLGLRRERATLRAQELVLRRDQANLDQGLHQMQHLLALSLRNLEQFYAQYERFQAVRTAARTNLDLQLARYNEGIVQFIVVLQAIVDWGNSVSNEAQALSQYNTELARLELQTGIILESHGIVFYEERFATIGPLGRFGPDHCFPYARVPGSSVDQYPPSDKPSEEYFDLEDPVSRKSDDDHEDKPATNLDEKIDFEKMKDDSKSGKPMTDEEIDRLLPQSKTSSRTFSDLIKRAFRR